MYLNLLNNAIDSLQQASYFYTQYLDNEKKYEKEAYSSLKLTILSLQISVEVFLKKILSEVSEFLIFNEDNIKKLLKEINYKITEKNAYPLSDIIIRKRINVQTIGYYKCLERAREIFSDLENEHYENLKELGQIRNEVVHFGIDREFEYFKIIRVINKTFKFFHEFIYPRYSNEMEGLNLDISDLVAYGQVCQEESWAIFYELVLADLTEFIKTLHSVFEEKLLVNGIRFEIYEDSFEMMEMITYLAFWDAEVDHAYIGISIETITEVDMTYLTISEVNHEIGTKFIDSVLGIIDYSKSIGKVYICRNPDMLKSSKSKLSYIMGNPSKLDLQDKNKWISVDFNEVTRIDFETIIDFIKKNHEFNDNQVLENVIKTYWQKIKNLFYGDWKELNSNK